MAVCSDSSGSEIFICRLAATAFLSHTLLIQPHSSSQTRENRSVIFFLLSFPFFFSRLLILIIFISLPRHRNRAPRALSRVMVRVQPLIIVLTYVNKEIITYICSLCHLPFLFLVFLPCGSAKKGDGGRRNTLQCSQHSSLCRWNKIYYM